MAEHANAALIRRAYADFDSGDLDLLGVVMSDDVVWHQPGRSPLAGDYKGREEILGYLAALRLLSGGTFRVEPVAVFVDTERAVVLQRETAHRDGAALDHLAALEFEIHRGRITEVTVYQGDAYLFDRFWE